MPLDVEDMVTAVMREFDGNPFKYPGPLVTNPATREEFEKRIRAALGHIFQPPRPPPAKDWIDGAKAVRWGEWRWPADILREVQAWGDRNCCRFILVSEVTGEHGKLDHIEQYTLQLYVAPKPNSRSTGLCELSIENRDRNLPKFGPWLTGLLTGRGLLFPGEELR